MYILLCLPVLERFFFKIWIKSLFFVSIRTILAVHMREILRHSWLNGEIPDNDRAEKLRLDMQMKEAACKNSN